jgi:hypothetical protein
MKPGENMGYVMGIDAEMFVRTKEKITPQEVLAIARRLAEAFWRDEFFIKHPRSEYLFGDKPRHCLSIVKKIEQDGPDILPEEGETFVKVHLTGRYYGVGYERGDLPKLLTIAGWLEANVPGGSVWYGGDSSGVVHKPFGKAQRDKLFKHFCAVGHEPYAGASWCDPNEFPLPIPKCELCKTPFVRYGAGRTYGAYSCHGCGFHLRTHDSGHTWEYWFGDREQDAKPFEQAA